jgi:thiosulfate dehydrogenase [quinone] large subunit
VPRVQPDHNAMSSIVGRARSETLPVWVLLPLRAFLGFTFVFAGLQKVADRQFFTAGAPGSIQLQLQASIRTSPVHFLVNLALHAPVAFGLVIALAEIAIGLGVTFGLIGRVAAAGGMLLSLLFFLTVSFNTWPYYYGSDIAFFFAWTPLVLAGSGPLSLDALLQDRARRKVGASSDAPLEGDLGRRALLGQLGAAGLVGAGGLFLAGLTAAIGRAANRQTGSSTGGLTPIGGGTSATSTGASTPGSTSPTSGGAHVAGTRIGKTSDVPVGGAASFTDPSTNQPAFVVQPVSGHFVAFSAICTHLGCTVGFQQGSPLEFVCPCHGSLYNATTGQVIQGPAVLPLPRIKVAESDGDLFADG